MGGRVLGMVIMFTIIVKFKENTSLVHNSHKMPK